MNDTRRIRVSAPPPKPLMLFDGDCHFCSRWIERWAEITGEAVEYQAFQKAGAQFPEIPAANFDRAVQLVEPTGEVFSGAEAVFRALGYSQSHAWLLTLYRNFPGFAAAADRIYNFIARRRMLASVGTRLLWGDDVRRPTFSTSRDWFLRLLGVIYLIAFVSLWVQVDGLIGRDGILPIAEFLPDARDQLGSSAIAALPTLCWLSTSNGFLHLLCGAGAGLSVLLIVGAAPALTLLLLFASYLSLTIAGQTFLSFQWDILLLETGFLAMFIAPVRWSQWRSEHARVSPAGLFLLKLLLFKLMLMSGVVKLTSGDPSWLNLTALDYHYWTQPLPTVLGWWADKNPEWLKKATVAGTFFVEIVVPFSIWAPRRFRLVAAALLGALQVGIALTGNYSFFNLLTIALCLLLIDDAVWSKRRLVAPTVARGYRIARSAAIVVLVVTLPLNAMLVYSAFSPEAIWPRPIEVAYSYLERFRIVNGYGLFRVMTKSRPEIVVEGSSDGLTWLPYRFRWKPGELNRAPRWVAPHQPRLDWQMWFAALSTYRQNPWFVRFVERLLSNSPPVVALLAENPFPDTPPRYIRAVSYEYRFATVAEHRETGNWWRRGEPNRYMPSVSLADFER
jgi:predicted DCC family thiol-disulfide oxidoreductase YuxK